jgi:hypothetical protein
MQENKEDIDMNEKRECYKCQKLSQWYFSCLAIFFSVVLVKGRPYKTWNRAVATATPAAGFSGGAYYAYLKAEDIKRKLMNNSL